MGSLAIDKTITLEVNGSTQRLRICAAHAGLPPLLVVQGGPALPVLHEVARFQRLLNLEQHFLVGYWEQRGCGDAPREEANGVSWSQQIEDLRTVLTWFHGESKQRVTMLGISIGATLVLQAVERDCDRVKAVIAVSPDAHTRDADAAADAFLQNQARRTANRRLASRVAKLARPPYVDSTTFQQRARLLADLGTIEYGKTFTALLRETLFGMIAAYGVVGTGRALRNVNLVLRRLLPQILPLDLYADPPQVMVPVHYVFGEQDALTPASVPDRLPAAIAAPASTVVRVANAGHMVHFDRPDIVRSIAERILPTHDSESGTRLATRGRT